MSSFLICLILLAIHCTSGNTIDILPKSFVLNMDLSADLRMKPLCTEYGEYLVDIYNGMVSILSPTELPILQDIMLRWFLRNAVEPYKSEIYYIAECTQVPLGGVVTLNLLYDLTAHCTSIVSQNEKGDIYHSRNLDYHQIPILRNSTYIATYINNNSDVLYVGVPFFGYVGLWTGIKYNAFSLSGDERYAGSLVDNIKGIHDDYWPSGWLIRDTLIHQHTFKDALHRLNTTKLMVPVYYILGGVKYPQGAIITRDQTHSYHFWPLNDSYLKWYQVETNYDWWISAPTNDDRRDASIQAMNDMTQANVNQMNLYQDVMSQSPVLNNGTIFTTIMSAGNQTAFYTKLRIPE